ncbi:AsmA family protein [Dongshaea marina]|uniref:AsmA family protein n=1 Tax=Dongshaea marina TaxID=2047966 RepID=UPI000D3E2DEA|nr:AsmA family protein [Dongshaea marina]
MKKLLYAVIIIIVLLVIGGVALSSFINPDQVKTMLVEQVKAKTGRQLVIDGKLSFSLFPTVGFTLGRTELKNPAGFGGGDTLSVDQVSMSVALLPLLSKKIEVGELTLNGAHFNLITLKDGKNNLQDLTQPPAKTQTPAQSEKPAQTAEAAKTPAKPAADASVEKKAPFSIEVAGINIQNAKLSIDNQQTGQKTELSGVNLKMARFVTDSAVPVTFSASLSQGELSAKVSSSLKVLVAKNFDRFAMTDMKTTLDAKGPSIPTGHKKVELQGDASYQVSQGLATLKPIKLMVDDITLQGDASFKQGKLPSIGFNFHSSAIDADKLLAEMKQTGPAATPAASAKTPAKPASTSSKKPANSSKVPAAQAEPDLSFLKLFNLNGKLKVDQFKVANIKMDNIALQLVVKNGVLSVNKTHADLYKGAVDLEARVDARNTPASFSFAPVVKGVLIQPLLKDATGKGLLAGTANFNGKLSGVGLSDSAIRKTLSGNLALNVSDGALYGINIPSMIRKAYAAFKGQQLPADQQVEKTDFSSLSGNFNIRNGLVKTSDLALASPLIRVDGSGQTNLSSESMDFVFDTKVVGSLKGQDGKSIKDLKGLIIPVTVKGSWQQPKPGLDLNKLLKEQATQQLKKKVEDKLKDKLGGDLLKGLFN